MIDKIEIRKYRKLDSIEINLNHSINIISGTNGTCKSSILYMVSNAFKAVSKKQPRLIKADSIDVIKKVNNIVNPKIESLTKGDNKYNDPAPNVKGTLYTCHYSDGYVLEFRRHNSGIKNRFSVKPYYKRGGNDSLPDLPIIYLGLSRLYAFGEYQDDEKISKIRSKLPNEYLDELAKLYYIFTGVQINYGEQQNMGDIKIRSVFGTDKEGIDSNTISAGEDNLMIMLTSLISLKYYFANIVSERDVESIMLIDEMDATLHPAYQVKLLKLMNEYSGKYKIKFVFTTHSISLLEYALEKKYNVIYLLDQINSVTPMHDVDIYKIKMYLHNVIKEDIYINRAIPIFTEDAEARLFIKCLFKYYKRKYKEKFQNVEGLFHFVDVNISGDALVDIFKDDQLLRSTMRSICIVDGDKSSAHELSNYTISLPGNQSPEELIFDYSKEIFDKDDEFWIDQTIVELGYVKIYYRDNILPQIKDIDNEIEKLKAQNKSTKGVRREKNKKLFNEHKRFFELLFKRWIIDDSNQQQVEYFYDNLRVLFWKVSEFHDISPNEWKV